MDKHIQEREQEREQPQEQKEDSGFTVVSLDESFFFYESCKTRLD